MPFTEASVIDILRCSQRDSLAVQELEDHIQSVLKLSSNNYRFLKKYGPIYANIWYYLMTSVSNLQTLGEEYTGTIRISQNGKIPTKFAQALWLLLFTCGEPTLEWLTKYLKELISKSTSLQNDAKIAFIESLDFFERHRHTIRKLHCSIFYINGKYYYISNRVTGIKYVLLRQWMQNNVFLDWFKFLGNISLFYSIFNFIQTLWSGKTSEKRVQLKETVPSSSKVCVLCCENRINSCCTPCGHIFCWNCIYDSLDFQQTCPLCRDIINPSRIVLLQNYA